MSAKGRKGMGRTGQAQGAKKRGGRRRVSIANAVEGQGGGLIGGRGKGVGGRSARPRQVHLKG